MPDVYGGGGGGGGVLFIVLSTDMTGRTMTGKVAKSMGHASRTNHGVRVLLNLQCQCLPPSLRKSKRRFQIFRRADLQNTDICRMWFVFYHPGENVLRSHPKWRRRRERDIFIYLACSRFLPALGRGREGTDTLLRPARACS